MKALTALITLVLAAAGVAIAVLPGDHHPRYVVVPLDNAGGLRDGSAVVRGGSEIGKLRLRLDAHDRLAARVELNDGVTPIARDSVVAVSAVNLLGRKRLEVVGGGRSRPAPSGYVFRRSQVSASTDLDQVLAVLDADTRSRLAILLSEAGRAVLGRKTDISKLLLELPRTLPHSTRLLNGLAQHNHKLASLVQNSDRLLAVVVPERRALTRLVRGLADVSTTAARERVRLEASLRRAPATLISMRRFLTQLRNTAQPLGPAARNIAAAGPQLGRTLRALGDLREAAAPALRSATDVAPDLTTLARTTGRVLRPAKPVANRLSILGSNLKPVSATLDRSIDDILAVVDNWTRAVEMRDGLSHVFRGQASVTAETLRSMLERLIPAGRRDPRVRNAKRPVLPALSQAPAPRTDPRRVLKPPAPVQRLIDPVTGAVQGLLQDLGNKSKTEPSQDMPKLLDYLLLP